MRACQNCLRWTLAMTELEEAELTEGQGRALSGHKTAQAYRGYAKETMLRALAATKKRHAHLLAQKQLEEQSSTEFPNGGSVPFELAAAPFEWGSA